MTVCGHERSTAGILTTHLG